MKPVVGTRTKHVKKFECRLLGPYLLNFLEVASISGRFLGLGGGLAVIVSWEGFFEKREEPVILIWKVSERSQKTDHLKIALAALPVAQMGLTWA